MIAVSDKKVSSFRKTYQGHSLDTTSAASASLNSASNLNLTNRKINSSTSKQNSKGEIISITVALLVFVVVAPNGILSAPLATQNERSVSPLKQKDSYGPNEPSKALVEGRRMKRELYDEDDDEFEPVYGLDDDDNMEMSKRGFANNDRARRVSMMRLKKFGNWQYPKRMSMMRLRRQYLPAYDNIRATRGMGNVSMLRLRRGNALPSLMRLKKMTQMRLKRMTQMRLKKSGMPQFGNTDEDDLVRMASENKRDAEETLPVVIDGNQD